MLKANKARMADVHATTVTRSASSHSSLFETAFLMSSHKEEAGDLRDRPKHRSSCYPGIIRRPAPWCLAVAVLE
jgi:hypothetical protein